MDCTIGEAACSDLFQRSTSNAQPSVRKDLQPNDNGPDENLNFFRDHSQKDFKHNNMHDYDNEDSDNSVFRDARLLANFTDYVTPIRLSCKIQVFIKRVDSEAKRDGDPRIRVKPTAHLDNTGKNSELALKYDSLGNQLLEKLRGKRKNQTSHKSEMSSALSAATAGSSEQCNPLDEKLEKKRKMKIEYEKLKKEIDKEKACRNTEKSFERSKNNEEKNTAAADCNLSEITKKFLRNNSFESLSSKKDQNDKHGYDGHIKRTKSLDTNIFENIQKDMGLLKESSKPSKILDRKRSVNDSETKSTKKVKFTDSAQILQTDNKKEEHNVIIQKHVLDPSKAMNNDDQTFRKPDRESSSGVKTCFDDGIGNVKICSACLLDKSMHGRKPKKNAEPDSCAFCSKKLCKHFKCKKCLATFPNAVMFSCHIDNRLDPNAVPSAGYSFKCFCGDSFKIPESYKHVALSTCSKTCHSCELRFKSKFEKSKHVCPKKHSHSTPSSQEDSNSLTCFVCKDVKSTTEELELHMSQHNKIKRDFVCTDCGASFYTRPSYTKHCEMHQALSQQQKSNSGKVKRKVSNGHILCKRCDDTFNTYSELDLHLFNTHQFEQKYSCDQCTDQFCLERTREIHQHVHNLPKRETSTKRSKKSSSDNDSHICKICSYPCNSFEHLEEHLVIAHNRRRVISCKDCETQFVLKQSLLDHVLHEHQKTLKPKRLSSTEEMPMKKSQHAIGKKLADLGSSNVSEDECGDKIYQSPQFSDQPRPKTTIKYLPVLVMDSAPTNSDVIGHGDGTVVQGQPQDIIMFSNSSEVPVGELSKNAFNVPNNLHLPPVTRNKLAKMPEVTSATVGEPRSFSNADEMWQDDFHHVKDVHRKDRQTLFEQNWYSRSKDFHSESSICPYDGPSPKTQGDSQKNSRVSQEPENNMDWYETEEPDPQSFQSYPAKEPIERSSQFFTIEPAGGESYDVVHAEHSRRRKPRTFQMHSRLSHDPQNNMDWYETDEPDPQSFQSYPSKEPIECSSQFIEPIGRESYDFVHTGPSHRRSRGTFQHSRSSYEPENNMGWHGTSEEPEPQNFQRGSSLVRASEPEYDGHHTGSSHGRKRGKFQKSDLPDNTPHELDDVIVLPSLPPSRESDGRRIESGVHGVSKRRLQRLNQKRIRRMGWHETPAEVPGSQSSRRGSSPVEASEQEYDDLHPGPSHLTHVESKKRSRSRLRRNRLRNEFVQSSGESGKDFSYDEW